MMTKHKPYGFYERFVKRPQDILCATLAIIVLSPALFILAALVRVKLGAPVIFSQQRPGREGKIFRLYKFRSMTNETDENGKLLPDEQRLTRFGRILRATSLDELPEIFNILKGDMSFVGPRPLAVSYLNYYTQEEHHRHDVRPGLTGLAQINGRNGLSWEDKFRYDLQYIEQLSFVNDVKILFQTVWKVLKREGIGQGEAAPVSLSVERKNDAKIQ